MVDDYRKSDEDDDNDTDLNEELHAPGTWVTPKADHRFDVTPGRSYLVNEDQEFIDDMGDERDAFRDLYDEVNAPSRLRITKLHTADPDVTEGKVYDVVDWDDAGKPFIIDDVGDQQVIWSSWERV